MYLFKPQAGFSNTEQVSSKVEIFFGGSGAYPSYFITRIIDEKTFAVMDAGKNVEVGRITHSIRTGKRDVWTTSVPAGVDAAFMVACTMLVDEIIESKMWFGWDFMGETSCSEANQKLLGSCRLDFSRVSGAEWLVGGGVAHVWGKGARFARAGMIIWFMVFYCDPHDNWVGAAAAGVGGSFEARMILRRFYNYVAFQLQLSWWFCLNAVVNATINKV